MDALTINENIVIDKTGYYYGLGIYDIAIVNAEQSLFGLNIQTSGAGTVTIGSQIPYVEVKLNNNTFFYVNDVDNQLSSYNYWKCCTYELGINGKNIEYVPIYFKEGDIISFRCVFPSVNITWSASSSVPRVIRRLPSIGYVARLVEN